MAPDELYSVLVIEDELPARELLVDYLTARPELKLAGVAKSGEEALRKLSNGDYDLAFLDIRLPLMSGIQVIEGLVKAPYLVVTTAYEEYALRAFEVGAADYLLKPFTADRFNRSVDRFLRERAAGRQGPAATAGGFPVRERGRHCILPYRDIMYVSSNGKNSVIHTADGTIETPVILKKIEDIVPADSFMRIHRQHIVNMHRIAALQYYIGGQYIAYLNDGDESPLPVGKKYAALLKSRLNLE